MENPIKATSPENPPEATESSTNPANKPLPDQLSDRSLEKVTGGQNAERAFADATSTVTVDRRVEKTLISEASEPDADS
ncbi:MAG: hypothetical protein AAFQ74_11575 [Cyanobacteria bacterium J06623_4]